jgi:glycosyltransferase involved in cell wall biosynthesis
MKILSPMAYGSGAFHVHKMLAENIPGYEVCGYNPYLTLFPPLLNSIGKDIAADIIHSNSDYGFFFKRKNKPLVLTFHGFVFDKETRQYSTTVQKFYHSTSLLYFTRKSLQAADSVTCVSKFTANMIHQVLGYDKPIRVIYNGINAEMFRPASSNNNGSIKVLFSGHPTRRKGADLLPEIARKLDKNIVIQYTSGIRDKPLTQVDLRLVNLGSIPFAGMPEVYQQADILLFPTVREGFGLVAAEAMACGLPVVATNCSSLPELVVHGKGGYLCELGNAADFAARINELANNLQLRRQMGDFNRERVEKRFRLDEMVKNYRELFEEVLG